MLDSFSMVLEKEPNCRQAGDARPEWKGWLSMHRRNQKWILSLLLLAAFLLTAPAAFATETVSSSSETASQTSSVASKEPESSSSVSSQASSHTSSNSNTSKPDSVPSDNTSSSKEELKLTRFWVYDGAGGDDITSYFKLSGYQISGTVPNGITSISIKADSNRATPQIEYLQQGLAEGTNNKYAKIAIAETGGQSVYYYINVYREPAKAESGTSSAHSKPVQSTVDWNIDGVSDASTPSELDSWQATDGSSSDDDISSEDASSEETSSAAVFEGTDEGGRWMMPVAIILIVLGVLGAAFVVCDILYTKGILKQWIIPRTKDAMGEARHGAEPQDSQQLPPDESQSTEEPPKPTDSEDWDEFFRDK